MFTRIHHYLLVVLAAAILLLHIWEYNGAGMESSLWFFLLYTLYAATIIYIIYNLVKDKRPVSFLKKITPLLVGIILAVTFPVVDHLIKTDGGKEISLSAACKFNLSLLRLDLRTDGTFKIYDGGPFGGDYYRGKYQLKDDTLSIDAEPLKRMFAANTFYITTDSTQRRYFTPVVDTAANRNFMYYRLEILPVPGK
jgi:hypothetical protein